ncbi:MAG: hypothetical protein SFZ03_01795 [Candidatus Melainabacteria bacterium]|nr:hypothetical protein [Candidatus Melainabacteria bacterium]
MSVIGQTPIAPLSTRLLSATASSSPCLPSVRPASPLSASSLSTSPLSPWASPPGFGSLPLQTEGLQPASVRFGAGLLPGPNTWARSVNGILERSGIGQLEPRIFNLSLEDMTIRSMLLGFYAIQCGYAFAFQQHPWETLSRNILGWVIALGIAIWTKSDEFGLNPALNHLMKERSGLSTLATSAPANKEGFKAVTEMAFKPIGRFFEQFQLRGDYFEDILRPAGVRFSDSDKKKAFWSKTVLADHNIETMVANYDRALKTHFAIPAVQEPLEKLLQHFAAEFKEGTAHSKEALAERLKAAQEKLVDAFLKEPATQSAYEQGQRLLQERYDLTEISKNLKNNLETKTKLLLEGFFGNEGGEKVLNKDFTQALMERTRAALCPESKRGLIQQFTSRINQFKFLQTAMITALTAVLAGQLLMVLVYRFIAPYDKDFVKPGEAKPSEAKPGDKAKPTATAAGPTSQTKVFSSAIPPQRFQEAPYPRIYAQPLVSHATDIRPSNLFWVQAPSTANGLAVANLATRPFNTYSFNSPMPSRVAPPGALPLSVGAVSFVNPPAYSGIPVGSVPFLPDLPTVSLPMPVLAPPSVGLHTPATTVWNTGALRRV